MGQDTTEAQLWRKYHKLNRAADICIAIAIGFFIISAAGLAVLAFTTGLR